MISGAVKFGPSGEPLKFFEQWLDWNYVIR